MTLEWDIDLESFIRGSAVEATTNRPFEELQNSLSDTWKKLVQIVRQFGRQHNVSVLVEVWPETGRVIFLVNDQSEFARVILRACSLERRYHEIWTLDDQQFESAYASLVDTVLLTIQQVVADAPSSSESDIVVTGRAADDSVTERLLTPPN
ncbi:MAG: hypothetical protein KDA88_18485 [Planctomycetaceae bacterium]|nr:hypothetical protein [Planctomycetaceae bacterium]MCB9954115.1 hypothetical protein [Planctomycetaceae bacterium]